MARKRKSQKGGGASTQLAAEKPLSGEEASAALAKMLEDADPKDAEQPKPAPAKADAKKDGDSKDEAKSEKKKVLALSEIEGEVKDGEKIRIGVEVWAGENKGSTIVAPFVVPTTWIVAGPSARPDWVHAINPDYPDRTLCRLPTDWRSGITEYSDDTYITCAPCSRRLIAVKKLDPKVHEQRRQAREKAHAEALAAATARKAAEKADKDAKAAAVTATAEKADETKAPARPSADQAEAKPDPKPAKTRTRKPKAA